MKTWVSAVVAIAACGASSVWAEQARPESPVGPTTAPGLPTRPSSPVDQPAVFTSDDLVLLEVSAAGETLSDGLGGYSSRAGVFVPLGELTRLLDLAVTIDPTTKRAEGWVLSPDNRFEFDIDKRQARASGKDIVFSPAEASFYNGEIYVRVDLLQRLLPLEAKVDVSALTMTIVPHAVLPFVARREREGRRAGLASAGPSATEPFLAVVTPYTAFTPPSIDINLALAGGNVSPKGSGEYDIRAGGDLAFAGLQIFAGSDQELRLDNLRVLLERADPTGKIAGPFGATRSDLGDTFTPSLALGERSQGGRGFAITSAPLEQANVFGQTDLRGELPLGYEVELYVNEVLRGSQAQPTQGMYEFLGVSLSYGRNVIRLVFYGPRGERREEVKHIDVGGGQLAKGSTVYNLGVVQEGVPVFNVMRSAALTQTAPAPGSLTNILGGSLPTQPTGVVPDAVLPGYGVWRVAGSLSHGLTDTVTATAGFASYAPGVGETREVGVGSIATSLAGYAIQLDGARDSAGGSAAALGVAGKVLGASVVARDSEYGGGFIDETQPSSLGSTVDLRRDTTVTADFVEHLGAAALPVDLRFTRDQFVDGEDRLETQARVSQTVGRYLLSSGWDYQQDGGGTAASSRTLAGALDASGLVSSAWQVRADLSYDAMPSFKVTSVSLTADHRIADHGALHLAIGQAFDSHQTTFQIGQTWRLPIADVSLVGSYTTNPSDFRLGLQLSFGLTWDPLRRQYRALGPDVASGGAVALQAFQDINGDGVREAGDTALPGMTVAGGHGPSRTTDAQGEVLISGLGAGPMAQVSIDPESIDNPYLSAPARVIRIVPRPGRVALVPYPLILTGEVELHMIFQRPGAAARGLSALQVQLIDAGRKVAAEGRTEYDGAVVLERVPPGTYDLRIDPEQAGRLKLALAKPVKVTVAAGGGFAGQVTAVVVAIGEPAATPLPALGKPSPEVKPRGPI